MPPFVVVHRMISGIDSFPLLAVPFFIFAGNLMNNAGITNRIYDFALALVGWLKGGLGHVNIIGSVIFAGMSGTAIADAAGLGTIEIKAMRDKGYDLGFSVGVTAASATLGPIIPPSLPFVIYAMMANVSVGQLFLAGIIPGVVMAVLMMLTVAYYAHKNKWGGDVKFEWARIGKALVELAVVIGFPLAMWGAVELGLPFNYAFGVGLALLFLADWKFKFDAVMPIMTPILLIGGMTTGVFTPTEGAIAACVWALVLGLVWYRTMTLQDARQGGDGHDRDDGDGDVHRRRRVDLRLAADRDARHRHGRAVGAVVHAQPVGVPAAREPADAVRRLLPRADRGDPDPRAGADAGRAAARHRPGAFRPRHGAEPDDRPAASTDGHGAVRARAGRANLSIEKTTMAILPWLVPLLLSLMLITYVPQISLWLPRLLYALTARRWTASSASKSCRST